MSDDLIHKSKTGVMALITGQITRFAIQIVSIVVMARLLSPADYGLTAIVLAIVSLGEIVRDFGLSTAAVQAESLNQAEKSNLFWINTLIGLILAVGLFSGSYLIASFYEDARLVLISQLLSVNFVINGLATQYRAGLNRDLNFKAIAFSESLAQFISTSVALVLAFHNAGYWAIVAQQLTNFALILVLFIYFHRWIPSLPSLKTNISHLYSFGMNLLGTQLVGQITRSLDTFIIGKVFGAEVLGIYNRAQQIVFITLNQINAPSTTLAVPVLSKLRNDVQEYYRFLNYGQSVLLQSVSLIFCLLAINAHWVVNLVLGDKWFAAIQLVQLLCIAAIFQVAAYSHYWICLSRNLMNQRFKFTLYTRPVFAAFILLGSLWNVYTVAIGLSVSFLVTWLWSNRFLSQNLIMTKELTSNALTVCFSYVFLIVLFMCFDHYMHLDVVLKFVLVNLIFVIILGFLFMLSSEFKTSVLNIFRLKKLQRIKNI